MDVELYKLEKREFLIKSSFEKREQEGKKSIIGFIPFNVISDDMGFTEIITDTAFNKTIADGANVFALSNHDSSRVLGSTRAGTMRMTKAADGLTCEVDLPNTQYAADLWEIINRGDVTTMSFGFYPVKYEIDEEGNYLLREVKLFEVSFGVTFPAYPATNSAAIKRSLEELQKENEELKRQLKEHEDREKEAAESAAKKNTAAQETLLDDIEDLISQ